MSHYFVEKENKSPEALNGWKSYQVNYVKFVVLNSILLRKVMDAFKNVPLRSLFKTWISERWYIFPML